MLFIASLSILRPLDAIGAREVVRDRAQPSMPSIRTTFHFCAGISPELAPAPPSDLYNTHTYDLKKDIILEWQHEMDTEKNGVCACCSRRVRAVLLKHLPVERINFFLLRNDGTPDHLLPLSYSTAAYDRALLNPKGLSDTQHKSGTIALCSECSKELTAEKPKMLKHSLANWLYYAIN